MKEKGSQGSVVADVRENENGIGGNGSNVM